MTNLSKRRATACAAALALSAFELACGGGSGALGPADGGSKSGASQGGSQASAGGAGSSGSSSSGSTGGASGSSGASMGGGGTTTDAGAGGSADAGDGAGQGAEAGNAGAGCGGAVLGGGPLTTSATHLDIGVHDPSMIWDGSRYYLFATGGTLNVRSSADGLTYTNAGNIFGSIPAWITTALGANPGSLWAPDISYFNGQFHVYYAGSTFGSNVSVIGLATTMSLKTPQWVDQGMVAQSKATDDFNAIDPNLSFDQTCQPWLAFGSFWSGIKMRKIDPTTGQLATDDTTMYSLASRNGGAIEAASIISHNGFYYLFVSFDLCCKGVNSTYRTMVGRGSSITGPYTDKAGNDMMTGAAEQLLTSSGRYIGPGGGTAWLDGTNYLYAYHYYDGDDNGNSKLQVRPITFDSQDWIVLGDPLFP